MDFTISEIDCIEDLGVCEEYVYDVGMTQSPHTFFANDILIHNSVFLNYGKILKKLGIDTSDANKEECVRKCIEIDKDVKLIIQNSLKKICGDVMLTDNMYSFETEEVISRMLLPSKKKYIARVVYDKTTSQYPDNEFTVKGMEFKKSNLSESIKKFLKKMTILIMDGATEDEVIYMLRKKFNELPNMPIDDIAYAQGVRNIEKYSQNSNIIINDNKSGIAYFPPKCPYHVAGALAMNTLIDYDPDLMDMAKITEGEKGKIVFVCPTNLFGIKAITIAQSADWNPKLYEYFKLDVEYMFNRLIIGPLQPTFDAVKYRITIDSILGFKFLDKNNDFIQPCLF